MVLAQQVIPDTVDEGVGRGGHVRQAVVRRGRRHEGDERQLVGAALGDEVLRLVGEQVHHHEAVGACGVR